MTSRHWLNKFWGRTSRRPMRTRKSSSTRTLLRCEDLEARTLLSVATQFSVVPSVSPVVAGTPLGVTVTAEDATGHTVTDFLGPVHFSSVDPRASLPADYTFTAADHGVHTFSGVVFRSAASQTLTATSYPIGTVTEFPLTNPHSGPAGITLGPDGNVWFTENTANALGKITPAGAVTEYTITTPGQGPDGITAGPDGNLWITAATSISDNDPDALARA